MRKFLSDLPNLLKLAYQGWKEDRASRLAAALAYYTIFSLAPLLVIVIAITGLIWEAGIVPRTGQSRPARPQIHYFLFLVPFLYNPLT